MAILSTKMPAPLVDEGEIFRSRSMICDSDGICLLCGSSEGVAVKWVVVVDDQVRQ